MSATSEEILETEQALHSAAKEHNARLHDQHALKQRMEKVEARIEKMTSNITKCRELLEKLKQPGEVVDLNLYEKARHTLAENRGLLQDARHERHAGKLKGVSLDKEVERLEKRMKKLESKLESYGQIVPFPITRTDHDNRPGEKDAP